MSATFTTTPGWLDWHQSPATPRFALPPGAVDAHCHVFGPRRRVPVRPGTQVHPLRCEQGAALLAARPPRRQPQRHRAGDLPRRGQQRDGRRGPGRRRPGARRRHRPSGRHRGRAAPARPGGRPGRAVQLRQAPGQHRPQGRTRRDRREDRAPRLACRHLLRGRRPGGAGGLLRFPAHPAGGGPHGTPGRDPARRRPGVQPLPELRRAQRRMGEGQLPGTTERQRTRRPRRRTESVHRCAALRTAGDRGVPGPGAVGQRLAAPQPHCPHARRRAARRLRAAGGRHHRTATQAAGGQPDRVSTGQPKN